MKTLNNQQGFVLVLSMIILTAVLLLVASMTRMLQSEIDFYSYNNNEKKAFYAAEAGVAYGKEVFWNDDTDGVWNTTDGTLIDSEKGKINNKLNVNGELLSLKKSPYTHPENPNQPAVVLTAKGLSKNVNKQVTTAFYIYNSSFNNSISSGGDININNNAVINGNFEHGDIYTKGQVNGPTGLIVDDSSSNKVEINDSDIYSGVSDDFIPSLDFEELRTIADNKGYIKNQDSTDPVKFSNIEHDVGINFTFVDGDLEIDPSVNDFNGSGVLVVSGQLSIRSKVSINRAAGHEDDYFTIIVKGDGYTEGIVEDVDNDDSLDVDNAIDMQGFIYSDGDTDFKNSFTIDGAIVTQGSLTVKNSMEINYESGYLDKLFDWGITFPESLGDQRESIYKIISWNEN